MVLLLLLMVVVVVVFSDFWWGSMGGGGRYGRGHVVGMMFQRIFLFVFCCLFWFVGGGVFAGFFFLFLFLFVSVGWDGIGADGKGLVKDKAVYVAGGVFF